MARQTTRTKRYLAAVAALESIPELMRLSHRTAQVIASKEPCALALAGERRLRHAARVGLFAGSFNPLTRAHVVLVNAALRSAGLDTVIWVCAAASVDKERVERASLVDRLAQMRAFTMGRRHDALVLLNRGLYVDEAHMVRALLPPSAELLIIVGFDKIVQIFDPRYYDDRDAALRELFSLAHLLVAPRGDYGADALTALLARPENRSFAAHVRYLDVPPTYMRDSSTEARALAAVTPADEVALARLLPPAALALALHTGAYYPATNPAEDMYGIRTRWVDALATLPKAAVRWLPSPAALVRETLVRDARGRALRAWLAGSRRDASALRDLLAVQAPD